MTIKKIILPAIALLATATAQAASIGNPSYFNVVETFASLDGLVSPGPVALGGGISATSSINATYGGLATDLGDNGAWGAGDAFAGIGDLSPFPASSDYNGTMTLTFASGQSGVGATFSIFQTVGGTAAITLEALSFAGTVLESSTLLVNFADPLAYNAGTFAGFLRNSNEIFGLRISGDGFVLDDVAVAPVPLPAGLPLLIAGLASAAGAMRRRRNAPAA